MDLAADVAEQALDRGVDVLVCVVDVVDGDRREAFLDFAELVGRQEARGLEPPCVDERALDVVGQQLVILRAQERPDLGSEAGSDAARPERHGSSSSGAA